MKQKLKYATLLTAGGGIYVAIELLWRGYTHWSMFLLGGACFVFCGLINEILPWTMPLWKQVLIGVAIVTALEFVTGCIVNMWLGWNIWDYSKMPGNILGQICPQYIALWVPLVTVAIILDDWLRYWWSREKRPHYRLL
ncbi:MAG: putative ABC transporter permease [Lachnospiraceae bacterium]